MTAERKTLKGANKSKSWGAGGVTIDPSKPTGAKTISKSFSIPPELLDELETEAARRKIETGEKISVSKLLVEFVYKGMKK